MASQFNIPLVFYGEMPGEYGKNISHKIKKFGTADGDKNQKGFELDPLKGKNLKIVLLEERKCQSTLMKG